MKLCNVGRLQMNSRSVYYDIERLINKHCGSSLSSFDDIEYDTKQLIVRAGPNASEALKRQGELILNISDLSEEEKTTLEKAIDYCCKADFTKSLEPIPLFDEYNIRTCFADLEAYNKYWIYRKPDIFILKIDLVGNGNNPSYYTFNDWEKMLKFAKTHDPSGYTFEVYPSFLNGTNDCFEMGFIALFFEKEENYADE